MAIFKQWCFLRSSLQLMVLSLILMSLVDTEKAVPHQLRGEVGGNVTFRCQVPTQRKIIAMYFQRGKVYVNGYYSTRDIPVSVWPNTRVDNKTNEVHMYGLNISHSGDYICYIRYEGSDDMDEILIRLNVTGNFTAPSVNTSCPDETHFKSCIVTCTSHGGFPFSNMTWNVSGIKNKSNNIWKVVNRSKDQSESTMLFTSSSTAQFDCSRGEVKFSCSVGDVTSEEHTICSHQEDPPNLYVIIVACLVVVIMFIVGLVVCWKCKKRPMGTAERGVMQELKLNEYEAEITVLTESKKGTEAS